MMGNKDFNSSVAKDIIIVLIKLYYLKKWRTYMKY